jgi:hypothetical protein
VFLTVVVGFVATRVERASERLKLLVRVLVRVADDMEGLYVDVLFALTLLLDGLDGLADTELLVGLLPLVLLLLEPPFLCAKQTEPSIVKIIKKTIFLISPKFNLLFSTHKYTTYNREKPEKRKYFSGEIYEI